MPNTNDTLDVKILGTETSGQKIAVRAIKKYLMDANIAYNLQEITDVSVFVKEGLKSIPSIRVNGDLIPLGHNGAFNRSLRFALNTILRKRNYGELEKFIIPIDFSDVSVNAFMYGHRMASEVNAITKAVHVFFPTSVELTQSTVGNVDSEKIRRGCLDEFVAKMDRDWGSDLLKVGLIDKEFRNGFPGDEILIAVEENDAELIVMGTTGDRNRVKKWFGSVSTKIMNEAKVPVLLVPEGARFKGVNNIVFAFDDINLDLKVIDQLVNFANTFDANIHLIHIQDKQNVDPGFYLQEQVRNRYRTDKIELVSLHGSDVVQTLSDYSQEQKIDIITMATEQRSFFNSIFHDSVTKRMSMHSEVPLLVLKGEG